ncbi:class I adenylate-forming enzyme family protein [Nocardioides insulae]|uniref:class I adenylate-forming enzyme family protein n=1 Tax=Nocardioides insulae TaxID=394734 RepID=UPI00041FA260|nr:AMP-binding protein [Nocardioides insulae]
MNLGQYLSRTAAYQPETTALVCADRRWSYAELEEQSNQLASALLDSELRPGDAVATLAGNLGELVVVEMALCKAGMLRVPISERLAPAEIEHVLRDSSSRVLLVDDRNLEIAERLLGGPVSGCRLVRLQGEGEEALAGVISTGRPDPVAVEVSLDAPAVLNFTSGSTGSLKAAVQTVGNRLANMRKVAMNSRGGAPGQDVYLAPGPITHASGMGILSCFFRGSTVVVLPSFDPDSYLATIERERVTTTFLVPVLLNLVLAAPSARTTDLSSLHSVTIGGAPISPARLRDAVELFGPIVAQGYGQGETTSAITFLHPEDIVRGIDSDPELLLSCGRPVYDTEVRVVDDEGTPLSVGEVGEVVARGPDCVREYFHAPEATAETFKDGWVRTGDLGRFREDGFLFLVDRKKDMIVSGGYNVYCSEVEAVLYDHPAVYEACVFGVPSEQWGETVKACLVRQPGADVSEDDLVEFCAARLSRVKLPRIIEFLDSLPRNRNGKIDRRALRERDWAGAERRVG